MADLVTLDEVSEALNLGDDTSHDSELEMYVSAVTEHVRANYGEFPSGTYTEIVHPVYGADGVYRMYLLHQPVLEVTSITDPFETEYTTGFTITADGYLEHDNLLTAGRWIVEYEAGGEEVPADLKLAALEDIRGLYQPGQIGPPAAFGAFGIENTDTGPTHRPIRLWPRVDAWIASRRTPAIA